MTPVTKKIKTRNTTGFITYEKKNKKPEHRAGRKKKTEEWKVKQNRKKTLQREINLADNNFEKENSMFILLTYKQENLPADYKEAYNDIKNFKKRLRTAFGSNIKTIFTIHRGSRKGRYHAHMLINTNDRKTVSDAWKNGVIFRKTIKDESMRNIITYMMLGVFSNNSKSDPFSGDPIMGKDNNIFINSRNLDKPVVIVLEDEESHINALKVIKAAEECDANQRYIVNGSSKFCGEFNNASIDNKLYRRLKLSS